MLLIAFAAAALIPQPGKIVTFKDWTVACDNVRRCSAALLGPEDGPVDDDLLRATIERDADRDAEAVLMLSLGDAAAGKPLTLTIDGKKAATLDPDASGDATLSLSGPLLKALLAGQKLQVALPKGAVSGSLAGLAATLRYIDAAQHRAGSVTALVATGSLPASAVPAPPAAPVITVASSNTPAKKPAPAVIAALRKRFQCEIDDIGGPDEAPVAMLSGGKQLILLSCGSGAYNRSSVPLVGSGTSYTLAAFDVVPSWGEQGGPPMLVNADWDDKAHVLLSYAKGRGIGDCGTSQSYVWDGARFRLIEQTDMGECRGSVDWLRTWTADTR